MIDGTTYYSIEQRVVTILKIKRSEFICTLEPVETLAQAKAFIAMISKEQKTAAHNCWAYIVGEDAGIFHSSDAGEPSGTAGKPMLNALQHHCLTDVAAVVTRYYGGVKLGVRGLMDAYFSSIDHAVSQSRLKPRMRVIQVVIHVAYEFNDTLINQLKQYRFNIRQTDYTQDVCHTIDVEKDDWERVSGLLEQHQAMGRITFVSEE